MNTVIKKKVLNEKFYLGSYFVSKIIDKKMIKDSCVSPIENHYIQIRIVKVIGLYKIEI